MSQLLHNLQLFLFLNFMILYIYGHIIGHIYYFIFIVSMLHLLYPLRNGLQQLC
jgi:hypothetical protein